MVAMPVVVVVGGGAARTVQAFVVLGDVAGVAVAGAARRHRKDWLGRRPASQIAVRFAAATADSGANAALWWWMLAMMLLLLLLLPSLLLQLAHL